MNVEDPTITAGGPVFPSNDVELTDGRALNSERKDEAKDGSIEKLVEFMVARLKAVELTTADEDAVGLGRPSVEEVEFAIDSIEELVKFAVAGGEAVTLTTTEGEAVEFMRPVVEHVEFTIAGLTVVVSLGERIVDNGLFEDQLVELLERVEFCVKLA